MELGVKTIQAHEEFAFVPALVRLLARGAPVDVEVLAAEGGWPVDEVRDGLARHPSVEWDDHGKIVGFGLTLRSTPHRFDFDERTVYGWCASDVLSFPFLLDHPGVVSSACPVTGRSIRVEVTPNRVVKVEPPEAVVSSLRPGKRVDDIRADICGEGLFFASREAASDWLEAHENGILHTVEEDFDVHKEVFERLGWV